MASGRSLAKAGLSRLRREAASPGGLPVGTRHGESTFAEHVPCAGGQDSQASLAHPGCSR